MTLCILSFRIQKHICTFLYHYFYNTWAVSSPFTCFIQLSSSQSFLINSSHFPLYSSISVATMSNADAAGPSKRIKISYPGNSDASSDSSSDSSSAADHAKPAEPLVNFHFPLFNLFSYCTLFFNMFLLSA